jgi:hypothetical protein
VFLPEAGTFVTAGFTSTTNGLAQIVSPTPMTAGVFHHVAATGDGARVAQHAATGVVVSTPNRIEVGSSAIDAGFVAGVIDDVRLYNRAFTAVEIATDLATPVDTVREEVVRWDLEVFKPIEGGTIAQGSCAAFFLSNKSESVRLFAAPDLDDGEQEDTNHDHRTGGV